MSGEDEGVRSLLFCDGGWRREGGRRMVCGGGCGCSDGERKRRWFFFNKTPFIFAEISIMPLNFNGNYTIFPSVIFVYVFLCPFIIAVYQIFYF